MALQLRRSRKRFHSVNNITDSAKRQSDFLRTEAATFRWVKKERWRPSRRQTKGYRRIKGVRELRFDCKSILSGALHRFINKLNAIIYP
ncbi:hypothetical protein EVAR_18675_1 [Eumeta japonica]|uniref:Uncharacterized protein n=1 Tax=Eumeta variegata TaxID=151549 RepID=A0A4C1U7Y1_EUMVA|nr:hypothetical protein EVAR_18675_1 [Eumeta japonica]